MINPTNKISEYPYQVLLSKAEISMEEYIWLRNNNIRYTLRPKFSEIFDLAEEKSKNLYNTWASVDFNDQIYVCFNRHQDAMWFSLKFKS